MRQILFFETIKAHWKENLPFVVYRKPNSRTFEVILQKNSELYYTADFKESGFVFAPFDNAKDVILLHADQRLSCDQTIVPLSGTTKQSGQQESASLAQTKMQHIALVNKALELLEKQQLQKVVLSRKEVIKVTETNPLEKFKNLSIQYPTAMVYCWYHPKIGMWMGATPETLLHMNENELYTMALAGTQPYVDTIDVVWGEKELQEQQLVSEAIVEALVPFTEEITASEVYSHQAGSLLHLRTDVRARLVEDVSLKQLLYALHPTPAVCGLPKEKAKQFILDNENYNRAFYTGFLGELHLQEKNKEKGKKTNLFVNLRCMQLKAKEILLYVGGGVTKASIPEKEWEETVKKTNTMKSVI